MKKICIAFVGLFLFMINTQALSEISSPSAILMDLDGNIIYEKNSHEQRAPASVTKIMTMLIAMESIESGLISLDDMVVVSKNAEEQGGTQVYLEQGEIISVHELLKCIAVSSANDASMALGEHISGTRESFVELMNKRAVELSMDNTYFKNPTGLTDDGHVTTAYDISIMSRELLKYENIYEYTTIWMDAIRDGEFELSNTNKLLMTYDGLMGLKTGYTSDAMYCISAVAKRIDQEFLAVVMGAESSDIRNAEISQMLDFAFANYESKTPQIPQEIPNINVVGGTEEILEVEINGELSKVLLEKNSQTRYEMNLPNEIDAPIEKGQIIGEIIFFSGDEQIGSVDLVSKNDIAKQNFENVFMTFIKCFLLKK